MVPSPEVLTAITSSRRSDSMSLACVMWILLSPSSYCNGLRSSKDE